jgi:tetratricopeptide (TPR) repeat protein
MSVPASPLPKPDAFAEGVLGAAASPSALRRLNAELSGGDDRLVQAAAALAGGDFAAAAAATEAALETRPDDGFAWYLLAMARDRLGRLIPALEAYEQALARRPDHADLAADLGRLAARLDMPELAAPLFALCLQQRPDSLEVRVNLAGALRDQHRYAEAIDLLRPALEAAPDDPVLWNALGIVMMQKGEPATAATFFREALRLDPGFAQARFNLSGARLEQGDPSGALEDADAALALPLSPADAATVRYARALTLLCAGRIGEGWAAYAARLSPDFAPAPRFDLPGVRWRVDQPLTDRALLVVGEQGLGDEVMFANVLPDVLDALGPDGRLTLAVEPRLVSLFQRSFPTARVAPHATDQSVKPALRSAPFIDSRDGIELWAPMGDLLGTFRGSLAAFHVREAYLIPDPARVTHWRRWLATLPQGRKVGLLWKSLKLGGERRRWFAPFEAWAPVFQAADCVFVNLQYGDCAAEIAAARDRFGTTLWTPPGLDLKDDLDGVAALSEALDEVIGFANATTNLAGAVGARLSLIVGPAPWPCLGSGRYPWYPQARVFAAAGFDDWGRVLGAAAAGLRG